MRTTKTVAVLAALGLTLAGCGGGSGSGAAAPATSGGAATSAAPAATSGAAPSAAATSGAAPSAGATSGGAASSAAAPAVNTSIKGDITVLTNRTDIVKTVFADYAKKFEAIYPNVHVTFQALTDYEGDVKIRLNTSNYGDVLLIPNSVTPKQLPTFFEPLGTVADLSKKYRFITSEQNYQGKSYGIAITGNANGFVYNKKVWAAAGITADPTTPAEFLTDLNLIKTKTSAIPLYTNYHDGWPLTQWESNRGGVSADPDAVNKLISNQAPWAAGQEHNTIWGLLYDAVAAKDTEADPTTTDWESSKQLLADGKAATMALGSWAITQFQGKAKDPADIGYLPFPVQVDGSFHSVISGDYKNAISIHSKHKDAARAWVDWFANDSNYATDQGGVSVLVNGPASKALGDFTANNVKYIELTPAPAGKESTEADIEKESDVLPFQPTSWQRLVDDARGAKHETKQQLFDYLDKQWAAGIKTVTG
ncbi:extracellular solute-binding protein [Acidothermaceae bacterium B102]|nr:extracellular solute-binding protein [Acidothermaceae bacterium B102]